MSLDRSFGSQTQPLARTLGLAIVECAALAAAASTVQRAQAQTSVSASITSEYSARGMSLSRGRPAPQLRVDYDGAHGWYAGAMASRVALPDSDSDANVQVIAYGGYTGRLSSGLVWEAGALNVSFRPDQEYQYHEFYAGLSRDRVEGRLYFSPSYYGDGKSVYAELNASWPLRERFTLTGHLGLLHPLEDSSDEEVRNRLDLRLGVGVEVGNCNLQLAVMASAPRRRGPDAARALALTATYAF
jgi:uncharacterized protein (TIGR02001 family)